MAVSIRTVTAGLVAVVIVAGCTAGANSAPSPSPAGDGADEATTPTTTSATSRPPSPISTPTDPFVIPEEIDEAYVQRVLDELWKLEAEARASVLQAAEDGQLAIPQAAIRTLLSIYASSRFDHERRGYAEDLERGRLPDLWTSEQGPAHARSLRILSQDSECVLVEFVLDLGGYLVNPPDPLQVRMALLSREGQVDRSDNPTPWVLGFVRPASSANAPASCDEVDGA